MDGIINVYKPKGITSHDVVSKLRKLFQIKRIGHTGTLDPNAEGVLPICVGKATRAVEYLTEKNKKYRAELILGIITDTQDITGKVIEKREVTASKDLIIDTVKSFVGEIEQIPPMYSAVRVEGKKLYELARAGQTVDRKKRKIKIFEIDNIVLKEGYRIVFDVGCSKGTYIRTLCNDIGEKLGCGACMGDLIRLQSGVFDINNSFGLEQIEELYNKGEYDRVFMPIDALFNECSSAIVKDESLKWATNGARVYLKDIISDEQIKSGDILRLYNSNNEFLALYRVDEENGKIILNVEKMFV